MKRLIIAALLLFAAATTFAQDDFELNITDSLQVTLSAKDSPMYIIVGYPDAYIDSLVRDCGADEEELDNLYIALDDYAFYLNACYTALDSLGWQYKVVDSDIDIYIADEKRHCRMPSRNFVGVVVYETGKPLEFVELLDFLGRLTDFDE